MDAAKRTLLVVDDNAANRDLLSRRLEGKGFSEWLPAAFDWLTSIGKPLIVGLPLLALLLSAVGYFVVRWAWRWYAVHKWRRRRRLRMNRSTPAS